MINVLHIAGSFQPGGGIDRVIYNYFSYIDHSRFRFNVLCHKCDDRAYAEKIEEYGGEVMCLPQLAGSSLLSSFQRVESILSASHYDVVHCHMANAAFLYLRAAKKCGVPTRILHSHQDHYADSMSHAIRNVPLVHAGLRYANVNLACSREAGNFLFGKRPYTVLRNAIPVSDYSYSPDKRNAWRRAHGIDEHEVVFLNVGRWTKQKNQIFILRLYKELQSNFGLSRLVFAGDGELKDKLVRVACELHLEKNVIWLSTEHDMQALYSASDVMIFPSLYEGLPMALVEAQAAGLPCFMSDTVSSETVISDSCVVLPIDQGTGPWVRALASADLPSIPAVRASGAGQVASHGFDISDVAQNLEDIYSVKARI